MIALVMKSKNSFPLYSFCIKIISFYEENSLFMLL